MRGEVDGDHLLLLLSFSRKKEDPGTPVHPLLPGDLPEPAWPTDRAAVAEGAAP